MSKKKLVIVESPAKIKTLKKFLGSDFIFESSIGHIRDLPAKKFGIDFDNDFEPEYEIMPDKKDVIVNLKKAAKKADVVYLAPDPDREGEAIAWHIANILPEGTKLKRTSFNSITKEAVLDSIAHPREIDYSLVNAQQARRVLDRMVGYSISPILTRRVKRGKSGTSAGRVQSVALKFVVDREKEIDAFIPVEYWTIRAFLSDDGHPPFESFLHSVDGKKVEKEKEGGFHINNEKIAEELLQKAKAAKYKVTKVDKKEKKRNPIPSFITSTLQQEASRHYGFSAQRTMSTAQQLYEGIDMGDQGTEGLITYMRTDSVQVAPVAINAARDFIKKKYGNEYLPEKPNFYQSKKAAQEAHEAIRPTNLEHPPEAIQKYLTSDQFKLYSLIFKRFIASQMNPAIYDTASYDIETDNKLLFRATGSIIKFKGFLAVYEEKSDSSKLQEEAELAYLPELKEGQPLYQKDATKTQSFTKPPPRYTEASLVKELEKSGIGRPSTYASIMNKIHSRDYTTKEGRALKPTELGKIIAQMLEDNFAKIMDVGFTAEMEDELELVAEGKMEWKTLIRDFWEDFSPLIEKAEKEAVVPKLETNLSCPKCGSGLQKIWARSRYFYGCEKYPDCDFTTSQDEMDFNKSDYDPDFDWEQKCPNCASDMTLRHGRFGPFLGCVKYPDCKGIVNIPKKGEETLKPEDRPDCPAIGCDGKIMMRRSRFGKTFYSCSNYPDCDVIVNELDQLKEKYQDHPKTAYVKKTKAKKTTKKGTKKSTKKTTKKTTKKREMPSYKLSQELAAVCNSTELTRADVLKKLWEYIKANNCQDPKNKRLIVPDAKLAKVFKTDQAIDMMKLAGLIKDHLIKE